MTFKLILVTIVSVLLLSVMAGTAFAGGRNNDNNNGNMTEVCHFGSNGLWELIWVPAPAVPGHVMHGDFVGIGLTACNLKNIT